MSENWETSNLDLRHLVYEIAVRLPDLDILHQRMRGYALIHPESMNKDFDAFRKIVDRHRIGDYRHRRSEEMAVRNIAQWSLDVHCELRNQPKKTLVWRD